MKKIMKEKNHVVPDEVLSKEFLSQFKTEADVSKFLKQLHAQVLEKMLEGEMDAHLGYEKNSVSGHNSGNSRNGSYPKKIQTEHGEAVIPIPRDRNGEFNPIVVPKHESRGLSIEKLVISLYAKGMIVSDIEEEMREIYEIELSTSAISIIRTKSTRLLRNGRTALWVLSISSFGWTVLYSRFVTTEKSSTRLSISVSV
jgi:putative transposase